MSRRIAILSCALLLACSSRGWAGRCMGFPDSQIVWCDDWDNYCAGGVLWPGYPPVPDTRCPSDGTASPDTALFQQVWPIAFPGPSIDSMSPSNAYNGSIYNKPFSLRYGGGLNSAQRHEYDMTGPISARRPGYDAVNGTDADPLVLRYFGWSPPGGGGYPLAPLYVELMLVGGELPSEPQERAPTDYVWANCSGVGWFPIVCQQRLYDQTVVPCPQLSTQVHPSLAFGWLAQLDTAPCHDGTGVRPTLYHAATFDGLKWWDLRQGMFGATNDFNHNDGGAWFILTIKTSSYVARLESSTGGVSEATIPRQYLGPFNAAAVGTGPGCELDSSTGTCIGNRAMWNYAERVYPNTTENASRGWVAVSMDTPVLVGGQYVELSGACCAPNGTCSVMGMNDCQAGGGIFRGVGTSCGQVLCCPRPFADADADGDVDQVDFAAFQLCYTGSLGGVPPGCGCFERIVDGGVDGGDFLTLDACYTGPNVPWTPELTPGCNP
ncbi:MAG TPA: hypothetical protein VLM89_01860 [Phycisphaerae bacterium]|nr:hypothetical protein [Phycisphaerae bacterium]